MTQPIDNKKIIVCSKCGGQIRIPADKHIRFRCTNQLCLAEYEYKNGIQVKPPRPLYAVLFFSLFIIIAGSFYNYLFPVPQLLGTMLIAWWICRLSKKTWRVALAGLLLSTVIGLFILLVLQSLINFRTFDSLDKMTAFVIKMDDLFMNMKDELTAIAAISFFTYLLLVTTLLFLAIKYPKDKIISKFVAFEDWIGKTTIVLIVVTSFSFLAPASVDKSLDQLYSKHFKIVYREKIKQERKILIADALRDKIEQNVIPGASDSIVSLQIPALENFKNIPAIVKEELDYVLSISDESIYGNKKDYYSKSSWEGSDKNLDKTWKEKLTKFKEVNEVNNDNKKKAGKPSNPSTGNYRRDVSNASFTEVKNASSKANEAVEALKAVTRKFFAAFVPDFEPIIGRFIDETVNLISDKLLDIAELPAVVKQIFNKARGICTVDVFMRIANYPEQVKAAIQQKKEKLAQLRRDEETRKQFEKKDKAGRKTLKNLAKLDHWEELRQKMAGEINTIECPFIKGNKAFEQSLANWKTHLVHNSQSLTTKKKIESAFWEVAKYDHTLIEAFARGIMWYEGKSLAESSTVTDGLNIYRQTSTIPPDVYKEFTSREVLASAPACIIRR